MKKVLFISNHAGFSKFNAPYMQWFHDNGWIVDNVSPGIEIGYYDHQYDLPISRSPFAFSNLKALAELKKVCKKNEYDLIHCHTPVGGVLGRLCVNNKKAKTKVLYTAHGFHFFKGARLIYWMIFYPIEKFLSRRTDCIVTINQEDFEIANKKFKCPVYKINGVGVNLKRFVALNNEEKLKVKIDNGFEKDDFILIYCAQFIPRKNHCFLIEKIEKLKDRIPNIKLCFVGTGKDEDKIKQIVFQRGLSNIVNFMGYRTDVHRLYGMSDILVSSSSQEGFGINLVEGMACGLPIVCSNVRGHRDILEIANINFLFDFDDNSFIDAVITLYEDNDLFDNISKKNLEYSKKFSIENSLSQMSNIYTKYM